MGIICPERFGAPWLMAEGSMTDDINEIVNKRLDWGSDLKSFKKHPRTHNSIR